MPRVYSVHASSLPFPAADGTPGMTTTPLILFAHGARDSRWAEPFEAMRAGLLAQAPGRRVELAFLEFMQPTLPQVAARLHDEGVRQALVVPLFLAAGGHLRRDLPAMVEAIGRDHPGLSLEVHVPLGESPEMRQAIVGWLSRL
jgi:sirohydrochlorin cobaltochelatase